MRRRRTRLTDSLTLAALLPALQACYEYRPMATVTPPVGETVAFQFTDQGRASLAERFGPGLSEIQGRVVSNQGPEYVVNVYRVSHIGGASAAWSGEESRINRSLVAGIKGRRLSPTRTALLSAVSATALYFLVGRELVGSFTGGREETPPDPPASNRRPLRLGF
jgi:hypothetical protein